MNWKKRIMTLGIVAVLGSSVLTGCRRMTPEGLIKASQKKTQEAESVEGTVQLDMKIGVEQSGISAAVNIIINMDMEMTNDPSMAHMKGTISIPGQNTEEEIEMYSETDGNDTITYAKTGGQWRKRVEKADDNSSGELFKSDFFLDHKKELTIEEKTVKEKKLYEISTKVSGDELQEMLNQMINPIDGADIPDMDLSGTEAKSTLTIYKDSGLPAGMKINLDGGVEIGEQGGLKMSLDAMDIEVQFDKYDKVDKIKIPEEALDAKEDTDDDDDIFDNFDSSEEEPEEDDILTDDEGRYYIMSYDGEYCSLVPGPEELELDTELSDSRNRLYFDLYFDDGWIDASYYTYGTDYYTVEELKEEFADDVEYYTEEGYTDIKVEDEKTMEVTGNKVKYVTLSYNGEGYTKREYLAWIKEDSAILVCEVSIASYNEEPIEVDEELLESLFTDVDVEGKAKGV